MRERYVIHLLAAASLAVSCSDGLNVDEEQPAKNNWSAGNISGHSLFHLESAWLTQDSVEVKLGALGGRPAVLSMIYTHCRYSCPRIVADMMETDSLVPAGDSVRFVLVSIDPENDRPDTLRRFMQEHGMSPERWLMLTGTEDGVRELAAGLGFRYTRTDLMDFAHTNLITLLSPGGEIVFQTEGFRSDKQALVDSAAMLAGVVGER